MTRRLGHGQTITIEEFQQARESVARSVAAVPLAFAAAQPVDLKDFDFMFPKLQNSPNNLLPESSTTPANLARLGKTMVDAAGNDEAGDSDVPAIMTYFGQFIDHDITLELASADLPALTSPSLTPLPLDHIRNNLRNARTATLDLDNLYDLPAPRDGDKMRIGVVTTLSNNTRRRAGARRASPTSTTCRATRAPTTRRPTARRSSATRATTRTPSSRSSTSPSCSRTTRSSKGSAPSPRRAASCASTTSTSSSTTS